MKQTNMMHKNSVLWFIGPPFGIYKFESHHPVLWHFFEIPPEIGTPCDPQQIIVYPEQRDNARKLCQISGKACPELNRGVKSSRSYRVRVSGLRIRFKSLLSTCNTGKTDVYTMAQKEDIFGNDTLRIIEVGLTRFIQ
ncbi:MAG: hypothetical protein JW828_12635 [Sedimentisphaerales bacterium]|nr:hypothetical protein [Sedimentisphaerales bacterium]